MKILKGCPATSQDDYQLNVTSIIKNAARNYGTQSLVVMRPDGATFTSNYSEEYERVKRLANALGKVGISPGDRVGVLDWNTNRHYELYFGIPGIGAVLLQMNMRLTAKELSYIGNHSGARLIFVDESLIKVAEAISSDLKSVIGYVIMTDGKLADIETSLKPIYSYEDLLKDAEAEVNWPMIDERSAYAACYTSGTTGKPKGVYYSHRNIYLHSLQVGLSYEFTDRDSLLLLTPMFHAMGWGFPQISALVGAKLALAGRYSLEDFGPIIKLMENEKISFVGGATIIFMAMLEYIKKMDKKPDFSGVRLLSGASEPPLAMIKAYNELTGADVHQAWGATETTPFVTVNRLKPALKDKLTQEEMWKYKSMHGYILPGIDLKIVDDEGSEMPHDGKSVGEILVRGPWITGSYFNAPGTESQFTEDGYWKSGDVGMINPEGYLKMVDRVKDLIKSGGEWISSVDMENEIMRHPAVLEATVIGLPHPKWEERPVAFVILKDGYRESVTKDDILVHLSELFSKWQLPDDIKFVDEIPKTSVGKFDKKRLKEEYKNIFRKGR